MVLLVEIPRTAGAASATRTTEEAEVGHRTARVVSAAEATVEEATMEQAKTVVATTVEEAIVGAVEATMGGPRLVLYVVIPRTAWATSATRAMEETEDGHRTARAVDVEETVMEEPTVEEVTMEESIMK